MSQELMGIAEIRALLGDLSRQRADQLTRRADFPTPLAELGMGKVWDGTAVRKWAAEDGRLAADEPPEAGSANEPLPILQVRTWDDVDDGSYSWKPSWSEWHDLDPEGDNVGDIKIQVRVKPKGGNDD